MTDVPKVSRLTAVLTAVLIVVTLGVAAGMLWNWRSADAKPRGGSGTAVAAAPSAEADRGETPVIGMPSEPHASGTVPSGQATLLVQSDPSGAEVLVDGAARGTTPCVLREMKAPSAISLELRKRGFVSQTKRVQLRSGQEQAVSVVLSPSATELIVRTEPERARVTLDGRNMGLSPVSVQGIEPGVHSVRAELDGYETLDRVVQTRRGESHVETLRLEKTLGSIDLRLSETGVLVSINGIAMGTTQPARKGAAGAGLFMDRIESGVHVLRMSKPGFITKTQTVSVEKGRTLALRVELESEFRPDYEVETYTGTFRGRLLIGDDEGSVRLEVAPGQVAVIPADSILEEGPLLPTE